MSAFDPKRTLRAKPARFVVRWHPKGRRTPARYRVNLLPVLHNNCVGVVALTALKRPPVMIGLVRLNASQPHQLGAIRTERAVQYGCLRSRIWKSGVGHERPPRGKPHGAEVQNVPLFHDSRCTVANTKKRCPKTSGFY
jgi:hypothetical protein